MTEDVLLATDPVSEFFWAGTATGKLLLQRCGTCARLRYPPALACPTCRSFSVTITESQGRGTVYTYAVPRRPPAELLGQLVVTVVVELDEGVRMLSALIECEPREVNFGMPVEVTYVPLSPTGALPVFRPRRAEPGPGRP